MPVRPPRSASPTGNGTWPSISCAERTPAKAKLNNGKTRTRGGQYMGKSPDGEHAPRTKSGRLRMWGVVVIDCDGLADKARMTRRWSFLTCGPRKCHNRGRSPSFGKDPYARHAGRH